MIPLNSEVVCPDVHGAFLAYTPVLEHIRLAPLATYNCSNRTHCRLGDKKRGNQSRWLQQIVSILFILACLTIPHHRVDSSAVLPGGTFPGPVIRGNKGDRFRINVHDALTDATMLRSTSIVRHNMYLVFMMYAHCELQHWHGIFQQKGSNWADGGAFISQCPIAANDSFLYDFQTVGQAGTFWYHSHLCRSKSSLSLPFTHVLIATQYCDGLRGALVLYDPYDPHRSLYDIDDGLLLQQYVLSEPY